MPAFPTPGPVTLFVRFPSGDLDITATPREDTVVEVRPADPSMSDDVHLAEETRVEYVDGTVFVEVPKQLLSAGRTPTLKVVVGLPEGSQVDFGTAAADTRMTGSLGEVLARTASGNVRVGRCAKLDARTANGDVTCDVTEGNAYVKTASGDIGLREVRGEATLTTASGAVDLGTAHGAAVVRTASGNVRIRRAGESVQVKGASTDVTVESVIRGSVSINTVSGDARIGVATGTSAWLDVFSLSGKVASSLDQTDQPDDGEKVEIHIKTLTGDISITRTLPEHS